MKNLFELGNQYAKIPLMTKVYKIMMRDNAEIL